MKYLSTYKIFESQNIPIVRDAFIDVDLEDMGLDVSIGKENDYIKVDISKIDSSQVHTKQKIEDMLISIEEYVKIHNLVMSKITFLHDEGIECHNVIYSFIDDDSKPEFKTLTDYLSKNENMDGLLNFLFGGKSKKMAFMTIYFN